MVPETSTGSKRPPSAARRYGSFFVRLMHRIGRHEKAWLISLVLIATGTWAFVELADEVTEGDTQSLDRQIVLALRHPDDLGDPLGPRWVEELGRDATALGGVGVLILLTVFVASYLALDAKPHAMIFIIVAIAGGFLVSFMLKYAFDRPRPDLVPHGSHVYTASFPSGHSMMAATTYLTLAALLARVQSSKRIKAYLLLCALILTVLVGCSRVYLGVHWPTDVLAGWMGGATWALACWSIALWLQRRGTVEPEGEEPPEEAAIEAACQ